MQISGDDAAYVACRSMCEGLVAAGVTNAVVSPGSRSMPLALTIDATAGLRTWVRIDERSAGVLRARAGQRLGTASAAGMHVGHCGGQTTCRRWSKPITPACRWWCSTADRPPEAAVAGAPVRAIDQHRLYGSHVRWFCETPVPSELPVDQAVRWFGVAAARAVEQATGVDPGPVHLNVPFREPLEPLPC